MKEHNLHFYQNQEDIKITQKLAKESIVHLWKGGIDLVTTAANNGYGIAHALHSLTYLDYKYKNFPLSKAYSFDPIPKDLAAEYHDKIIGFGAQI